MAEMGACFLLSEAGIEPQIEQSASYIASWLKVLKGDKRFVVSAASQAGKARGGASSSLGKEGGDRVSGRQGQPRRKP